MDLSKTYAVAFVAIREIAVALRVVLISKGKDELDKVMHRVEAETFGWIGLKRED